jgi:hypothetical protein
MCYKLFECVTLWDTIVFMLGIILSAFASILVIRFFRPKIKIEIPEIDSGIIKFPVKNLSKKYFASNLKIEAAAVLNRKTYHLKFDMNDFLMLPSYDIKNTDEPYERKFHATDVNEYTKEISAECKNINQFLDILKIKKSYLRVRIHANHEFTGFGKAFESKFKYKKGKQIFKPLSSWKT